jgi:hypothetical protein
MTTSVADSIPLSRAVPEKNRGASRFFWGVTMFSSFAGGLVALVGIVGAQGAPQEAAAAAIGCLMCIGPYVLARSIDELRR